ncbi:ABC transporter permease [Clostridium omnivorum]|uniref:ABC transporter permease n=1 Tax=Clostridium omnivorum TaxID=1604902 RepID=A0ABQ5N2K9_9CLOT|nr:ABC transporter permease [Clostridium sp. E14]GLC29419.1 ABC transporter permease [Clostridium sp. E14]
MIRLIQIEFQKFIRRKKFLIALIILILCCMFCLGAAVLSASQYNGVENEIKATEKYIKTLEEQGNLENDKGASTAVSNGYTKIINDMKGRLAILKRTADESIPWQQRVKEDIQYSKYNLEKNDGMPPMGKFQELSNIMLKQYYLNKNIPYDYNKKISSFNIMPDLIRIFSTIGLLIIVSIMVLDVVSGENKPATIKLLATKPIERWKIILSKFIVCVVIVNVIILLLELIMFIFIGLIFGFGDPSLPIVAGIKYDIVAPGNIQELKSAVNPVLSSGILLSQGTVLLKILILQILAITACISFCFLCSTAIQNSSNSTGAGLVLIAFSYAAILLKVNAKAMYRVKPATIFDKVLAFLFTSQYDGLDIVTGKINESLAINFIDFRFSVLVLLIWIVVCYSVSHIIFVRKDILA